MFHSLTSRRCRERRYANENDAAESRAEKNWVRDFCTRHRAAARSNDDAWRRRRKIATEDLNVAGLLDSRNFFFQSRAQLVSIAYDVSLRPAGSAGPVTLLLVLH
jgi:phage-related baseplate assembly protein